MSACVIGAVHVTDPAGIQEYAEKVGATVDKYGGHDEVRGKVVEVLEGDLNPHMTAVIAFETVDDARRWYESEEYSAVKEVRQRSARTDLLLLQSVDH
ncbi:MAG: DUF1330 domain-containing protein [Actinomycetota bacterium]